MLSTGPGGDSREQPGWTQQCFLLVMLLVPKGDSFSSCLQAGEEWPYELLRPHWCALYLTATNSITARENEQLSKHHIY